MHGDEFFQEIASRPPLTKLHPRVASFLKTYLAGEKVILFGGRQVINTQFQPYPGRAFESLLDHFLKDDGARTHLESLVDEAGLAVVNKWEGSAVFRYSTAGEVLDHLLTSGAGTVFYDAIDRSARDGLTREFLELLQERKGKRKTFQVRHDYVACIAERK